jgi:hypothetical protein
VHLQFNNFSGVIPLTLMIKGGEGRGRELKEREGKGGDGREGGDEMG